MSLSRKRRKELKRLRSSAEELWGNQQDVLDHASKVAREARRQLNLLAQEEVVPRVRTGYESYVRPRVDQARGFAQGAGDTVERTLGGVVGSLLSIGDVANDTRVRRALARTGDKRAVVVEKKGAGIGTYLAIGAGIVAAAGVAYAVWQTFRADDELWVADDEPSTSSSTFMRLPIAASARRMLVIVAMGSVSSVAGLFTSRTVRPRPSKRSSSSSAITPTSFMNTSSEA